MPGCSPASPPPRGPKRSPLSATASASSARHASVRQLAGTSTRVIDAEGRVVIPGINDAHVHAGAVPPERQAGRTAGGRTGSLAGRDPGALEGGSGRSAKGRMDRRRDRRPGARRSKGDAVHVGCDRAGPSGDAHRVDRARHAVQHGGAAAAAGARRRARSSGRVLRARGGNPNGHRPGARIRGVHRAAAAVDDAGRGDAGKGAAGLRCRGRWFRASRRRS